MGTATTIVLVEDESQYLFVYRWLLTRGIKAREVRLVPLPSGQGAGEAHVLKKFAGEVAEYRSRAKHLASRTLIVAIDADTHEVPARLAYLEKQLTDAGKPKRGPTERICVLVPKRNIETWLRHFHREACDETTSYRNHYQGDAKAPACKKAGEAFHAWLARDPAPAAPPSLQASRAEAARLP